MLGCLFQICVCVSRCFLLLPILPLADSCVQISQGVMTLSLVEVTNARFGSGASEKLGYQFVQPSDHVSSEHMLWLFMQFLFYVLWLYTSFITVGR